MKIIQEGSSLTIQQTTKRLLSDNEDDKTEFWECEKCIAALLQDI